MKRMKKCSFVVLMFALMLVSCVDKTQEQLRDFAIDFAQKVSKNQVDSLKEIYPKATLFDSLALTVVTDSIIVKESGKKNEFVVRDCIFLSFNSWICLSINQVLFVVS